MSTFGNLWAIGYDDMARAQTVRAELLELEGKFSFKSLDTLVVVRNLDGSFLVNRKSPSVIEGALVSGTLGFLAGLIVLQPLAGPRRLAQRWEPRVPPLLSRPKSVTISSAMRRK